MASRPLLSVIVPMYNCGAIITRCLNSIDYPLAEIIVVDDGSTDNGVEIVIQYIETHSNVKLIQKENGGVSSARNIGIEAANGKYIVFMDADDYIVKDGISRVIDVAEEFNADVVKYKIVSVHSDDLMDEISLTNFPIETVIISGTAAALHRYDISDYHVVDAVFKRSLIIENKILFDEDLHLHEDDVFMGKIYCVASQVVDTHLPLYRYVVSSSYSSTHRQSQERNRILIHSGLLAILHRSGFIKEHMPNESFPLEKYKYMRWVCSPRQAVEAGYSFREYLDIIQQFKNLSVYPLSYRWIKIAGWDYDWKVYAKKMILTFLLNHPRIGYAVEKIRIDGRKRRCKV